VRDLDLKTLRLFKAVCESGNIKQAAQREHIEPSAISKRIGALEEHLGVVLLHRTPRGVQPTLAGASLLEHTFSIFSTVEKIEAEFSSPAQGSQEHVRLLASPSVITGATSLIDEVAIFMGLAPNREITVNIEEQSCTTIAQELRNHTASLGICWDRGGLAGLESLPYGEDELVLAVGLEHPLAQSSVVKFDQTLQHEYVSSVQGTGIQLMLQEFANNHAKPLVVRALVSSFDAALRIVAGGRAISILPLQVIETFRSDAQIRIIRLDEVWAKRRFSIFFRKAFILPQREQRLLAYLAERNRFECAA
jgi:DNA-binding transcriptional LysR family regulator